MEREGGGRRSGLMQAFCSANKAAGKVGRGGSFGPQQFSLFTRFVGSCDVEVMLISVSHYTYTTKLTILRLPNPLNGLRYTYKKRAQSQPTRHQAKVFHLNRGKR